MTTTLLKKIYLSSLNFLEPLTPEKTYATIVKEATKLVDAQWGSILLEQDGELQRVYSSIPLEKQVEHRKRGFLYKAFKKGFPTLLRIRQIEKVHPEIKHLGVVSDVIIPLSYKKKSIGILAVLSNNKDNLTDEEIQTLVLFGSMASLAIQKAKLYDETQKTLENRDFFISAAAHEIKTPVTTIFGYAQLLNDSTKKGKIIKPQWINSLHAECFRLKFLINDFLEASRISTGRLHFVLKECSVKAITERVIDNFRFNYPERKLVFKNKLSSKKDIIIGDQDRLIQAITNILDNAAKFSSRKTEIYLNLSEDNVDYLISVQDKGKGIPKKDLSNIFEQYYKGKENEHEGLGLGLFLVKSIIDYHHGSVHLRSRVNVGTIVEIRLPKVKV